MSNLTICECQCPSMGLEAQAPFKFPDFGVREQGLRLLCLINCETILLHCDILTHSNVHLQEAL